jgi:mycoredoxin
MNAFDIGHPERKRQDRSGGNPPEVVVYWRPGCPYCARLRAHLRVRRLHPPMVNISADPTAAAFVRSVAGGTETVPTVVIDGVAHVNPRPRLVVAALRRSSGAP